MRGRAHIGRAPGRRPGFTLLEAVLATAVFAIFSVGVITALKACVEANRELGVDARLQEEVRSAFDFVLSVPLELGEIEYETAPDVGCRIEVSPSDTRNGEGTPLPHIYRVEVLAAIGEDSRSGEILIYEPSVRN